ncbi:MAG: ThiF family adenylyltransferase [Prevotella sp.]|nr:ThiF family adenylyltransferase [Prevotella sp.]
MNSCFRQDRVSQAHVMVVGCGALGNEVLKNLVLMGVQYITVVDFDVVEEGNLTRSVLFTRADADIGRLKTETVAQRLRVMNPHVEVKTICGDIAYDVGLGLIRQQDVLIGCVDNRWARYRLNRLCMRAGKPWVDGGIDTLEGTVRVFMPGRNCYACSLGPEGLRDMARRMPCAGIIRRDEEAGKAPTTSIVASVIGAVQVQEALKLLHGEELADGRLVSLCGSMFYYEGERLSTRRVAFEAYDDDCPEHEQWSPVEKTELAADARVGELLAFLESRYGDGAKVVLENDCFVDYVERRSDNRQWQVRLPGHKVADYVDSHEELKGLPQTALYQHELYEVGPDFPCPELTLRVLGIPSQDVLHVVTTLGDRYMELRSE